MQELLKREKKNSSIYLIFERLLMLGFILGVYGLYQPLSKYVLTLAGNNVETWIDRTVPLEENWLYIYAMVYLVGMYPVFVIKSREILFRVTMAYFFLELISYVIFVSFPVHMHLRPQTVEVNSFITWGLKLCYWIDAPTCCLPSLHVSLSILATLVIYKVDSFLGRISAVFAILISISTLFVKQHFFADFVSGFLVSWLSYRIFVYPIDLSKFKDNEIQFSRSLGLVLPIVYCLTIITLFLFYKVGWAPWQKMN